MHHHPRFLLPVVTAAVLSVASLPSPSFAQETPKWDGQKWEYRVVRIADTNPEEKGGRRPTSRTGGAEEQLQRLGQQGWELIAVRIDAVTAAGRSNPIFYFKRPVK